MWRVNCSPLPSVAHLVPWRNKLRLVCADIGRTWIPDDCFRSILPREKVAKADPLCGFAGHQYGRFQCAAVDYLSTRDDVDAERIGILGICGWGGMALNAAAIDTRIKATVTATMYDMSRVNANGYFDSMNADARHELRRQQCSAYGGL